MTMRPVVVRPRVGDARISSVDDLLARLFASRGVSSDDELDYALGRLLPVSSLENIAAAVELVLSHRERRVLVVGDFDVDGATSTALLLRCLADFGFAEVDYLVPNRFDFGYGLSPGIVDVACRNKPSLIITVDNGISSVSGVAAARSENIDVLITDHHLPGDELPDANVILNPNLPGSRFGSKNLAGVGVAFYLVAALGQALQEAGQDGAARVAAKYIDLVALGTVADVVPLDHNNRILVAQGLKRIRAGATVPGIPALLTEAGRSRERCVASDLGFAVGPRLNAAGRLDDMSVGIECLLTDDAATAARHAQALDAINRDRRDIEQTMRDQAFRIVDKIHESRLPACVCLFDESWHQGVVGLVAGRVKEKFNRPVAAFALEDDTSLKGSVRSVAGVHARDLLEAINSAEPGLIRKFGGHAMAAGLTLDRSAYETFREQAQVQMRRLYPQADFSGTISSDGVLPGDRLTITFARELRNRGPWGSGFPEPAWHGLFHVIETRVVGEHHLKLKVRPADGAASIDAIAFNQAETPCRGIVQLAYRLDVNEWRGVERPQLVVEQIAPASSDD
ncbi:MAG: single-stranded-DNA-specific exonuclease RecJ [Woeseiaceae bacterium]|nr:single-stranded-DNA-specific exonuclease RecJ [Woeseiaceae bacterium]